MVTEKTKGVVISVEAKFEPNFSTPEQQRFLFSYKIRIKNTNEFPIQLMRRHWKISCGSGELREVEGPGVIGLQPIIQPNEEHEYDSACDLHSAIGAMTGTYLMRNNISKSLFRVHIPSFSLEVPYILN